MNKKSTVLDLFSGCGGLSYGFEKAGFEVKYGIDNWADALKTFKYNHKNSLAIQADLGVINAKELIEEYKINDIDFIIGGPPCQGFSIAGHRNINDERNLLYKSYLDFIAILKPSGFLLENVPNIMSMGKGSVKENIIEDFTKIGYKIKSKILLASEYGVPQNRRRAFFVGFKNNDDYEFPEQIINEIVNTKDAISDLPDLDLEDGSKYPLKIKSQYQQKMRNGIKSLHNHQLTNHTPKTVKIISLVPDGGNYKNLPEHLKDTRKVNIAWTRLNSLKPSFTIDTGHRHHFHYEFNRVPTVRESARIQSFPDDFIFLGSKTSQYKQVGNAVPPMLAEELAKSIKKYL
ncbi:DNA (cytosine-5)-methyltransferase 1 [Gillisia sp. Hel1_33_143]|uniref:DNA cytosine methyltransferase n=1 Tax=Gillisia sp. Hel1_33_143 TaxID=1336796 RepID=UPI00087D58DB|nr:DNA cytosine methyltransferase [Gillisia sp. Hel1_33_143]SDS65869.1 DNA (cytosine-5)-methyltransferase 1 [Gillisia sp. Hel1_33_143]